MIHRDLHELSVLNIAEVGQILTSASFIKSINTCRSEWNVRCFCVFDFCVFFVLFCCYFNTFPWMETLYFDSYFAGTCYYGSNKSQLIPVMILASRRNWPIPGLMMTQFSGALQWRHNECDGVSNNRSLRCLFKCWFRRRLKKTSKHRVTGLCAENSPVTGEFPTQRAPNAENVSIWWRQHCMTLGPLN